MTDFEMYIVVEGPEDSDRLRRVLPSRMQGSIRYALGGGKSGAISTAATLLFTDDRPVAVVLDADETVPTKIEEQRTLILRLVGKGARTPHYKVFLAVPNLESELRADHANTPFVNALADFFDGVRDASTLNEETPVGSGLPKLGGLRDLYFQELKELLSAETQLLVALPEMAQAASNAALRTVFLHHLEETAIQRDRLEQILISHHISTDRIPKSKGMEALIKEAAELVEEVADVHVRDAGLIAAAQRVKHYEMAGYGCARAYAHLLGDSAGAKSLQTTLDEEGATDKKLTQLAVSVVNEEAVGA